MKRNRLPIGVLLLAGLCGCLSTRHVEQTATSTTGIDANGSPYWSRQATHDERQWRGPWFGQPDVIRP